LEVPMKRFLYWIAAELILLFLSSVASGQQSDSDAILAAMNARLMSVEGRVSALEAKFAATAPVPVPPAPALGSFQSAQNRAVAESKPLIVWAGKSLCPGCVTSTADKYVHYVGTPPGFPTDALIVGLPENGAVKTIAIETTWPAGHIPTVEEAIRRYRAGVSVGMTATVSTGMSYSGMSYASAGYSSASYSSGGPVGRGGRIFPIFPLRRRSGGHTHASGGYASAGG
jgi:hypothetical protein